MMMVSTRDLLEISSHIPKGNPEALHIPSELETICDILSPKWVRDFIFSNSPVHVPHLVSPSLQMSSVLWASEYIQVYTSNHAPLLERDVDFFLHTAGCNLFVPIRTSGHRTIGVGVYRGRASSRIRLIRNSTKTGVMRHDNRFVYDSERGIFLRVADMAEDGSYIFSCCTIRNTKAQSYSVSFFKRNPLQTIALDNDDFLPQDLLRNLTVFQAGVFPHDCSVCGQHHEGDCSCETVHSTALSQPFNISTFFQALTHHSMTSTTCITRLVPGQKKLVLAGSRVTLRPILDEDILAELSAWSVWAFTSKMKESPRESQSLITSETTRLTTNTTTATHRGKVRKAHKNDQTNAVAACRQLSTSTEDEYWRRKERRRESNRRAARRYNVKQRIQREGVETELASVQSQVAILRKKEHN